jgi:hypothetical protein
MVTILFCDWKSQTFNFLQKFMVNFLHQLQIAVLPYMYFLIHETTVLNCNSLPSLPRSLPPSRSSKHDMYLTKLLETWPERWLSWVKFFIVLLSPAG